MELSGDAVKKPSAAPKQPAGRGAFGRHLEGWQLGALTVGLVLTAALVAVPRAAPPTIFPVPLIDVEEAAATRQRFEELAERAVRQQLPFEARAVGDAVRRLGRALAGIEGDASLLSGVLRERVGIALRAGQREQLLQLRAVQARLFVAAVRAHTGAGSSDELSALGGDFVRRAGRSGWLRDTGSTANDDELRTLYVMRWTDLTGLREQPGFAPSLGELRRYYRFLLLHPERGTESSPDDSALHHQRLRYVEALAKRDPEYPAGLARGVLLGKLGMAGASAAALRGHLSRSTKAGWDLRARNHLVATMSEVPSEEAP